MNRKRETTLFKRSLSSLGALCWLGLLNSPLVGQPPPNPVPAVAQLPTANNNEPAGSELEHSEGVQHLTRGPLHEAFAEAYQADPRPSPIVPKQPPELVNEVAPDYRPEGDNVVWVAGYWSWDEDRSDFIWISGVWRDVPPNHQWVPGYWSQASGGFQYVSGFWASNQVAEIQYLPAPPASLEQGPSSPAPADNYFYIPGHWVFSGNEYRWQPGYWAISQENWVWIPNSYVWTPRGCIYQAGYWDYDIPYRGIVFTPVYYQQPVYTNPRYVYRPRYVVATGLELFVHMFVRPNHRQYYFGDYYGQRYSNSYHSWSTYYQGPRNYDPFYNNYRVRGRVGNNVNLLSWIVDQHRVFAENDGYRPAATIAAQREFLNTKGNANLDQTVLRLASLGETLDSVVAGRDSNTDFVQLKAGEIENIARSAAPLRELVNRRMQVESAQDASVNANANARISLNEFRQQFGKANINANVKTDANTEIRREGKTDIATREQLDKNKNIAPSKDGNKPGVNLPDPAIQIPDSPGLKSPDRPSPDFQKKDGRGNATPRETAERFNPNATPKGDAKPLKNKAEASNQGPSSQLLPTKPENWPFSPRQKPGREVPNLPQSQPSDVPASPAKSRDKPAPTLDTSPKQPSNSLAPNVSSGPKQPKSSIGPEKAPKPDGGKRGSGGENSGKGKKKYK